MGIQTGKTLNKPVDMFDVSLGDQVIISQNRVVFCWFYAINNFYCKQIALINTTWIGQRWAFPK